MVVIEFGLEVVNVIVHATSHQGSPSMVGSECTAAVFASTPVSSLYLFTRVIESTILPETHITTPYFSSCPVHRVPLLPIAR